MLTTMIFCAIEGSDCFDIVSKWQTLIKSHPTELSFVMFLVFFHSVAFTFELCDCSGTFRKHKIFHATRNTPTFYKMLPQVIFNQVFVLFPLMLLWTRLGLTYDAARDAPSGSFPLMLSFLSCATIAPLIHEVLFYVPHRFVLHSHWGFSYLKHSLHHSSRAHSAISAMYMAPIDFTLECALPYLVPLAVLTRFSLITRTHAVLMLPVGALGGLYEHSGYNFFPAVDFLDTRTHGLHHAFHNCSFANGFGSTNVLDHFLKTACNNLIPAAAVRVAWSTASANLKLSPAPNSSNLPHAHSVKTLSSKPT